MKYFLTASALLFSFLVAAQFPNLPYNPDENADGLIGVADLQALLANYGNEFASAVVSEDGESAIVFIGQIGYFECEYSCEQLPGIWRVPRASDLVPVFSELHVGTTSSQMTRTWLDDSAFPNVATNYYPQYLGAQNAYDRATQITNDVGVSGRCYCAAKQLPRVEYSQCSNCIGNLYGTPSAATIAECCSQKVAEGWYPLGGTSPSGASYPCISQSFWRWAE